MKDEPSRNWVSVELRQLLLVLLAAAAKLDDTTGEDARPVSRPEAER